MNKDEEIRINATIAEMGNAIMRAHARSSDLAAECASLSARLAASEAEVKRISTPDSNVVPIEGKP